MDINVFYFSVRKQEQNTLQLQHSSLIKTVAEKVNSFQNNWLSRQLHWTRQFFFYQIATFLRASTRYVSDMSRWIQVCIRNVSYACSIFRKIRTHANVFYFSVRVSSSHGLFWTRLLWTSLCTRCCSCCRCCCRHRRHRYHYDLCILVACNSAFVSVYTWCSQVWRSDQLFAEPRRAKRQSRSVQRSQHLSRSHLPVPPT